MRSQNAVAILMMLLSTSWASPHGPLQKFSVEANQPLQRTRREHHLPDVPAEVPAETGAVEPAAAAPEPPKPDKVQELGAWTVELFGTVTAFLKAEMGGFPHLLPTFHVPTELSGKAIIEAVKKSTKESMVGMFNAINHYRPIAQLLGPSEADPHNLHVRRWVLNGLPTLLADKPDWMKTMLAKIAKNVKFPDTQVSNWDEIWKAEKANYDMVIELLEKEEFVAEEGAEGPIQMTDKFINLLVDDSDLPGSLFNAPGVTMNDGEKAIWKTIFGMVRLPSKKFDLPSFVTAINAMYKQAVTRLTGMGWLESVGEDYKISDSEAEQLLTFVNAASKSVSAVAKSIAAGRAAGVAP